MHSPRCVLAHDITNKGEDDVSPIISHQAPPEFLQIDTLGEDVWFTWVLELAKWREIAITLKMASFGEEKAHTCVIA
jgi:hypothetical protein